MNIAIRVEASAPGYGGIRIPLFSYNYGATTLSFMSPDTILAMWEAAIRAQPTRAYVCNLAPPAEGKYIVIYWEETDSAGRYIPTGKFSAPAFVPCDM